MKRIDKNGKKRELNIEYIYKKDGIKLEDILKEEILSYIKNLNV